MNFLYLSKYLCTSSMGNCMHGQIVGRKEGDNDRFSIGNRPFYNSGRLQFMGPWHGDDDRLVVVVVLYWDLPIQSAGWSSAIINVIKLN